MERENRERRKRKEETGRPQPIPDELRRRKEDERSKLFNRNFEMEEEEGWQKAGGKSSSKQNSSRTGRGNRVGRHNMIPVTSIFISNLPEGIKDIVLLKNFAVFGDLLSVYVAKKRDKFNNLFGFLRFANVSNVNELVARMSNVCIDGAKIGVNLAKYDRWNCEEQKKGNEGMARNESKPPSQTGFGNPVWNRKFQAGQSSYKDVLSNSYKMERQIMGPSKTVILSPIESLAEKQWSKCSLWGEVKNVKDLGNLNRLVKELGFLDGHVRYVGGLSVLVTFVDEEEASDFLLHRKETWKNYFDSLKVWDGKCNLEERLTWIIIKGVPVSLWDPTTFDIIGNSFGKVVVPSSASILSENLSFEKVGILIRSNKEINENIIIKRKDQAFKVHVYEDLSSWLPEVMEEKDRPFVSRPSPEYSDGGCNNCFSKKEFRSIGEDTQGRGLGAQDVRHATGFPEIPQSQKEFENGSNRRSEDGKFESGGPNSTSGPKSKKRRKNKRKRSSGSPGSFMSGLSKDFGPSLECLNELNREERLGSDFQIGEKSLGGKTGASSQNTQKLTEMSGVFNNEARELNKQKNRVNPQNSSIMPNQSGIEMEEEEVQGTMQFGESVGVRLKEFEKPVRELVKGEVFSRSAQ